MEYRIECMECEQESVVIVSQEAEFCPLCGRRGEATMLEEDLDYGDEEE